jgi:hypothetical protein
MNQKNYGLLFIFLLFGAMKTFACDCAMLTTEQAIDQSKAVFSGEVLGFEYRKGIPNQFMDEQEKLPVLCFLAIGHIRESAARRSRPC